MGTNTVWPAGRRRLPARVEAVIRESAERYSVTIGEILGPGHSRGPASARKMAMVRLRGMEFSYPEIGRMFGGRHHTSVMHAVRTYVPPRPVLDSRPFDPDAPDLSGEWAI